MVLLRHIVLTVSPSTDLYCVLSVSKQNLSHYFYTRVLCVVCCYKYATTNKIQLLQLLLLLPLVLFSYNNKNEITPIVK